MATDRHSTATAPLLNTITPPDDGDRADAASLLGLAQLQDEVKRLAGGAFEVQSLERILGGWHVPTVLAIDPVGFTAGITSGLPDMTWVQASISTQNNYLFHQLKLPQHAQVSSISVYLNPGTGRSGGLPATMPNLSLYKVSNNGSGPSKSTVFSQNDPSASLGTYETHHIINHNLDTPEVIDNENYDYLLVFSGEKGAHAQTLSVVNIGSVSFTTATDDDRGAA